MWINHKLMEKLSKITRHNKAKASWYQQSTTRKQDIHNSKKKNQKNNYLIKR